MGVLGFLMVHIGVIQGLYRAYMGIIAKNMETTI